MEKSSLINIICGLFDDYDGSILFSGKKLNQINLNEYQSYFSYVPQQVYLLDDTILNNIIFSSSKKKSIMIK